MSGLLWQQCIVDAYCVAEGNRLAYLQHNQENLRVEKYHRVCAALDERRQGEGDADAPSASTIGRRVVLPASYAGSPGALQQSYYDAMAMVREFGKPDFFITITANPAWPEVSFHPSSSLHSQCRFA